MCGTARRSSPRLAARGGHRATLALLAARGRRCRFGCSSAPVTLALGGVARCRARDAAAAAVAAAPRGAALAPLRPLAARPLTPRPPRFRLAASLGRRFRADAAAAAILSSVTAAAPAAVPSVAADCSAATATASAGRLFAATAPSQSAALAAAAAVRLARLARCIGAVRRPAGDRDGSPAPSARRPARPASSRAATSSPAIDGEAAIAGRALGGVAAAGRRATPAAAGSDRRGARACRGAPRADRTRDSRRPGRTPPGRPDRAANDVKPGARRLRQRVDGKSIWRPRSSATRA